MFVNYESVCVDSSHSIGNPVNRRFGDVDIYHWQLANTTAQHGWALAMGNCRTSNDQKTCCYGSICCGDMVYSTVGTVYGTVHRPALDHGSARPHRKRMRTRTTDNLLGRRALLSKI